MFFGYLSEFWNSLTTVVADVASTTITYGSDFFEGIGNAVSGALSGVFIFIFQPVIDFFLAIFYGIGQLVFLVISPIVGVIMYVYSFISGIFSTLSGATIIARYNAIVAGGQFDTFLEQVSGINTFLNSIPGFSIVQTASAGVILALAIIWFFKLLTQ